MESNLSNMTSEEKELMEYISRHYDSLQATFNKNQKEIWEKFDDCSSELTDLHQRKIFVYAFQLGARIAFEVMSLDIK